MSATVPPAGAAAAAASAAGPGGARGAARRQAWGALSLAVGGVLAYALTLRWPWSRESGVLAFVPLAGAAWLALRALRAERRTATRLLALAALGVLLAFAWVFFVVARLPAPAAVAARERLPSVAVEQPGGPPLDLARVADDGPVLLVVFRGPW